MKRTLLALSCVLAAAPALAARSLDLSATAGSQNYRGAEADFMTDLRDHLYLEPWLKLYRSDLAPGTFADLGARIGDDSGPWKWGGELSIQPKNAGYSQFALGGDLAYAVVDRADGVKLDLGGSYKHIEHSDDQRVSGAVVGPRGRMRTVSRSTAFTVGQNDLGVFGLLKNKDIALSASVTQSVYSKDLSGNGAREAQFLALSGFGAVVQGFPKTSASAKLRLRRGTVRPFVSYTHTSFELGDPPSNAWEGGASAGNDDVELKASYERYNQAGLPPRNYGTVAAAFYF